MGEGELRIAAARQKRANRIALSERRDVGAEGFDDASRFEAGDVACALWRRIKSHSL